MPSLASSSIRERRDRTSANSAATKNPLTAISRTTRISNRTLIVAASAQAARCGPACSRPIGRTYFEGDRRRSLATSQGYRTPRTTRVAPRLRLGAPSHLWRRLPRRLRPLRFFRRFGMTVEEDGGGGTEGEDGS